MKQKPSKGFTLVELVVSVGIAAVLMMGMAAFFSNTFRSMFTEREKAAGSQGQAVVSAALQKRFANTEGLQEENGTHAVILNNTEDGTMPFTYIGTNADNHVVFKDFFVFNGMNGSVSSSTSDVDNPGGIALIGTSYYVTAPLENKIYKCNAPEVDNCLAMNLSEELSYPIDVTSDAATNMLYVTDAGNNRIIQIEDPAGAKTVTVLAKTGLNFPTGIQFYSWTNPDPPNNSEGYLFVSDTYNHLVKRITLPGGTAEVVVGDGNDEVCDNDGRDHTALFCKLNFPTGLMIQADELYIADTGNGRVLKVSDPSPNLSDFELALTLIGDTQISKIDFVLPNGSVINSLDAGAPHTLHKGKMTSSGEIITYNLSVTYDTQDTTCIGGPLCVDSFRGFYLNDAEDDIFEANDSLEIEGNSYTVSSLESSTHIRTPWSPLLPGDGKDVTVTNVFAAGDYSLYLDLSNMTFPEGFQLISIEPYNETPIALASNTATLRVGDGKLGTEEDIISVMPNSPYTYLTGLGWSSGLQVSDVADYSTSGFQDYDYVSSFKTQNFDFSTLDFAPLASPDLLELTFEALLGHDPAGEEIWKKYSLSANIKQ